MEIREARQVTGRTLEEIEALAADATPGPWVLNSDPPYDSVVGSNGRTVCCDTAYYPTAVDIEDMRLIAAIHNLLAIAQGQREEIAAKDKKILALRIESKTKDDAIQKIEQQLQEANECRDPAYFAQLGRKRR